MLKKFIPLFFILGAGALSAKPITSATAKKVAQNFYTQNTKTEVKSLSLAYTQTSATGTALYYAFNINTNDGFVIVTADDAAKPILGYDTKNSFVKPEANTTIAYWLTTRAKEVANIQQLNLLPTAEIALDWVKYSTNNPNINSKRANNSVNSVPAFADTIAPLVKSTWNQSPYYNALCPGGSVAGCVATAMAQIMRYWNYPTTGTGSSSYCDCTAQGFSNNYNTLSANYGATTYNWANMPLSINTHNADVAILNYHCGVSVEMDYDPNGSGAYVCVNENPNGPACAQNSYVNYFKYDPTTIKGLQRTPYNDSAWTAILKTDLNIGRPIQYAGDDPVANDGHTWVCDGYDINDFFHMNWGWGGYDNGYFYINNLQTTNGSFNPSINHEVIVGIVPMASNTLDASIPSIANPSGFYCGASGMFTPTLQLQNFGNNNLTSCTINYQIDNGAVQTLNWTGNLVFGQATTVSLPSFTSSTGSHTLVCYSSAPNGATDQNTANDQSTTYFNLTASATLPVVEGFESNLLPSAAWSVSHTGSNGTDFAVTTNAAATGAKCAMLDNMNNTAGNTSILQTSSSYNLSTFTTPALSFKVAYQEKATTNNDKFQVYTSIDCGASWQSKWARWSPTLSALAGTSATAYTPSVNEFTTYTVDIHLVAANTNVLFRWAFYADPNGVGNNLYIDDINIVDGGAQPALGIKNIETLVNLNLYPNPSTGVVNVDFNFSEKHSVALQVNDMLGRVIETMDAKTYQAGETTITLGSKTAYQTGVYFVNITVDGQKISKKVIVE
ncbi:MAG TPA: C10 family peptidase [Bacteroidia bacterium]|nr:C10 family peptidase [Bacteroidia bacterium]